MNFENYIKPEKIEFFCENKPIQSVYLEFVRHNCAGILALGEFEALRRWIECIPLCMPIQVYPSESHRITREFYKALRAEQKATKNL